MAVLTVQDDTPLYGDPMRSLSAVADGDLLRVSDSGGELAVFTAGCKTVTVRGQSRTFTEQKRPFTDDFDRTPLAEWGSSPGGGVWGSVNGVAADYSIVGGKGLINPSTAGVSRYMRLSDTDIATYNIRVDFTQDLVAAGASQSVTVITGYSGVDDHYRFRVTFNVAGSAAATIAKIVAGVESDVAAATVVHAAYADTDVWHLRVTGDAAGNLAFSVWRNADAEPAIPTRSGVDATYTSGRIGLRVLRSAGSTANVTVSFDDFAFESGIWANPPVITHNTWVRTLDEPFTGWTPALAEWVRMAALDTTPDALYYALSFITGAPTITDPALGGAAVLGESGYGPLTATGGRAEGGDFNDFMGVSWVYPASAGGTTDVPEVAELGCMDCSGYVRMVFCYWMGIPPTRSDHAYFDGVNMPRASADQGGYGPGVVIAFNLAAAPSLTDLRIGDLLFFDATNGGDEAAAKIDHVGIYLGEDTAGKLRFGSSRKTPNGPTFADLGAASYVGSGTGLYATSVRVVRRT